MSLMRLPTISLFLISMIWGVILIISSQTPLMVWIGMEINLLAFIPLMNMINNKTMASSSMKYFLVQAIMSFFILFLSMGFMNSEFNSTLNIMVFISLMSKLGMPPYHFWLVPVMENLSWENCFILSTLQKIGPLMLIFMCSNMYKLESFFLIMGLLVSGLGGLSQVSFRSILAYSSIGQMVWCLLGSLMHFLSMMIFFIIYCTTIFLIMFYLNFLNYFKIWQISKIKKTSIFLMIFLLLLSMSGMPPMMGFYGKLLILVMSLQLSFSLGFILLVSSSINLFMYLNMSFSVFLINSKGKFNMFNYFYFSLFFLFFFPMILILTF